jgi:hypothetical protein
MIIIRRGRKNEKKEREESHSQSEKKNFGTNSDRRWTQKSSASIHSKGRNKQTIKQTNKQTKGRKSHPIEEQKLCVIFKSPKPPSPPPPNKSRPPKRAFTVTNEIILYKTTRPVFINIICYSWMSVISIILLFIYLFIYFLY